MDKLEEKIEESKKLPQEIKDNIDETCFFNIVIAILITFFFAVINYSFYKLQTDMFMIVAKAMAFGMAIVSVGIFEHSYREDKIVITLYGIETIICAILTAFIPYVYIYAEKIYRGFIMTVPLLFAAYYVLKTIITYISKYSKYRRESITDIKEILDNSGELRSYIDDDSSSKLLKEQQELEAKIAEEKRLVKELEKKTKELEKMKSKQEKAKRQELKSNSPNKRIVKKGKKDKNKDKEKKKK